MIEWNIEVIGSSINTTVWADTYMEAELQARILFGTKARLKIEAIVDEMEESEDVPHHSNS